VTATAPLPADVTPTRFILRGKTYSTIGVGDMTVKMLLELEQETADFGRRITLAEFERMNAEYGEHLKLGGSAVVHPAYFWLMGIAVWAARKMAGEDVTFSEAIDFAPDEIKEIPAPRDHQPKTARKAAAKSAPRKARSAKKAASGRADARPAAAVDSASEQPPSFMPE